MADIDFVNYTIAPATISGATAPTRLATMPVRLRDVLNVKDFGATGDGTTNDQPAIQAAFDEAWQSGGTPHGPSNATLNKVVFFPSGHYKITEPLVMDSVYGARVIGSGQGTTLIENTTLAGDGSDTQSGRPGDCIYGQGVAFCMFQGMTLKCRTSVFNNVYGAAPFRMGVGTDAISPLASQSNSFYGVTFDGGQYGLHLGADTNIMSSESMIAGCVFKNQTATNVFYDEYSGAGVITDGNNACDESVLGSWFENCFRGIYSPSGVINIVQGTTFKDNVWFDIDAVAGARDCFVIKGCSSNSTNFISATKGTWLIESCRHDAASNGVFVKMNARGGMVIKDCISTKGTFEHAQEAVSRIENSTFGRSAGSWLIWNTGNVSYPIELENVLIDTTQIIRQRLINTGSASPTVRTYAVA